MSAANAQIQRDCKFKFPQAMENLVCSASGLLSEASRFIRKGRRFAADRLSMILKNSPVDDSTAESPTDDSSTDCFTMKDSTMLGFNQFLVVSVA